MSIAVASGMRSRIEALDVLANNIANANTAGFKADREFYNLYVSPEAASAADELPSALPVVERHWTDFSAGTLSATGNPLDIAIDGEGFFAVNGPSSEVLYTRNGNFHLNAAGELETQTGYSVRDSAGKIIKLSSTKDVTVATDGAILQNGQPIATLQIASPPANSALEKAGATYFRLNDREAIIRQATSARVQQGRLEMANAAPAEHAVRLVTIMRQFEMLQKALSISADMGRKSIEEVARVSG